MSANAIQTLISVLAKHRLLEANQLEEVRGRLAAKCADVNSLAKELIRRGWLTTFQATNLKRAQELVLGPYILLDKLGEGGMGAVFKARHSSLGRVVALKLIRKDRLTNPDAIKRFEREIRAAAQLEHPNIVRAFDADEVNGAHFFVMEYVEGIDLDKVVKKCGPQPVADACDYIRQAALGLQHAHERGMVHRDIKPANLLLAQSRDPKRPNDGLVKILAMGLARLSGAETQDSMTLTREGSVMGTPDYIAPEQVLSTHDVDIRADLYSLGCTLYYLLTARVPFPGGSVTEKLLKHQIDEATPVEQHRPEVPPRVADIIRKLMAKRPADRFQSPAELVQALDGSEAVIVTAPATVQEPPTAQIPEPSVFAELQFPSLQPLATEVIKARKPQAAGRRTKRVWLAAAGGPLLLLLVVIGIRSFLADSKPVEKLPVTRKASDNKKMSPAVEAVADHKKKRLADEKQRADQAEAALPQLEAKFSASDVTFASFAKEVQAFNSMYGGTPAAIKAAERLMKLPSPLDQLDAAKIAEPTK